MLFYFETNKDNPKTFCLKEKKKFKQKLKIQFLAYLDTFTKNHIIGQN